MSPRHSPTRRPARTRSGDGPPVALEDRFELLARLNHGPVHDLRGERDFRLRVVGQHLQPKAARLRNAALALDRTGAGG